MNKHAIWEITPFALFSPTPLLSNHDNFAPGARVASAVLGKLLRKCPLAWNCRIFSTIHGGALRQVGLIGFSGNA